jgi:hypothetical protein
MPTSDMATDRLNQGKEALIRGDFKQALKDLSVSISIEPSVDAYVQRAESNFNAGNISAALGDLNRAEDLCSGGDDDNETWVQTIGQARNRYEGAVSESQGPPVRETISILIPTALESLGEVIVRISNRPELSTDGTTLMRPGGTVIYDIEVFEQNSDWANLMIEISDGHVSSDIADAIAAHNVFLHLSAPNWDLAQGTTGQVDLATQTLMTLEPLMRALSAPAVLMRNSNAVHTHDEVQALSVDTSSDNLPNAFAKLYNSGNELFSAGMHSLGYADVEIPYSIMKFDTALDVLCEFLVFQLINETWEEKGPLQFESAETGGKYEFELRPCQRFTEEGNARFNPNGLWHMTKAL